MLFSGLIDLNILVLTCFLELSCPLHDVVSLRRKFYVACNRLNARICGAC